MNRTRKTSSKAADQAHSGGHVNEDEDDWGRDASESEAESEPFYPTKIAKKLELDGKKVPALEKQTRIAHQVDTKTGSTTAPVQPNKRTKTKTSADQKSKRKSRITRKFSRCQRCVQRHHGCVVTERGLPCGRCMKDGVACQGPHMELADDAAGKVANDTGDEDIDENPITPLKQTLLPVSVSRNTLKQHVTPLPNAVASKSQHTPLPNSAPLKHQRTPYKSTGDSSSPLSDISYHTNEKSANSALRTPKPNALSSRPARTPLPSSAPPQFRRTPYTPTGDSSTSAGTPSSESDHSDIEHDNNHDDKTMAPKRMGNKRQQLTAATAASFDSATMPPLDTVNNGVSAPLATQASIPSSAMKTHKQIDALRASEAMQTDAYDCGYGDDDGDDELSDAVMEDAAVSGGDPRVVGPYEKVERCHPTPPGYIPIEHAAYGASRTSVLSSPSHLSAAAASGLGYAAIPVDQVGAVVSPAAQFYRGPPAMPNFLPQHMSSVPRNDQNFVLPSLIQRGAVGVGCVGGIDKRAMGFAQAEPAAASPGAVAGHAINSYANSGEAPSSYENNNNNTTAPTRQPSNGNACYSNANVVPTAQAGYAVAVDGYETAAATTTNAAAQPIYGHESVAAPNHVLNGQAAQPSVYYAHPPLTDAENLKATYAASVTQVYGPQHGPNAMLPPASGHHPSTDSQQQAMPPPPRPASYPPVPALGTAGHRYSATKILFFLQTSMLAECEARGTATPELRASVEAVRRRVVALWHEVHDGERAGEGQDPGALGFFDRTT